MYENLKAVGGVVYDDEERQFADVIKETLTPDPPLGSETEIQPFEWTQGFASSDNGDVSWMVPMGSIVAATWVPGTPAHSWQAVAADGIQLIATARVTVRANIQQLVGGAGEDTILARVGEGIVTSIGSANTHKAVLENPDKISKLVLERGLDAGTAFEILSIDIADVDVGINIGAKLQIDQASADLKVAEAKAEERKRAAIMAVNQ